MTAIRHCFTALLALMFASGAGAQGFPQVLVETTAGDFVIELDAARSPITVENFLQYVRDGHYNGTVFHRIVNGFVIQGGGFDVELNPKPTRESIVNESGNGLSNKRMTVAMARTSDAHSADSQFYINLAENVALDPKPTRWGYAVFGQVIEGMDVVDDIGYRPTVAQGDFQNLPASPVIIQKMSLVSETAAQ